MKRYNTLSETMNELRGEGYTKDFNLQHDILECRNEQVKVFSNKFKVDKFYRFEGESNPSDSSILYAISSDDSSEKGLLVNAYGIYSDPQSDEMLRDLDFRQESVSAANDHVLKQ